MTYFNVDIDQFAMGSRINISCRSDSALVITELYNMWWIQNLLDITACKFDNRVKSFRRLKYFRNLSATPTTDKNIIDILISMKVKCEYGICYKKEYNRHFINFE